MVKVVVRKAAPKGGFTIGHFGMPERGCGKTRFYQGRASGAEARHIFSGLAARVELVPFPKPSETDFFRKL